MPISFHRVDHKSLNIGYGRFLQLEFREGNLRTTRVRAKTRDEFWRGEEGGEEIIRLTLTKQQKESSTWSSSCSELRKWSSFQEDSSELMSNLEFRRNSKLKEVKEKRGERELLSSESFSPRFLTIQVRQASKRACEHV